MLYIKTRKIHFLSKLAKRRLLKLKIFILILSKKNKYFYEFFFFYKFWKCYQLPFKNCRKFMLLNLFKFRKNLITTKVNLKKFYVRKLLGNSNKFKIYKLNFNKKITFVMKGFFLEGLRMVSTIQKLYCLKRKDLKKYAKNSKNESVFCNFLELRLDVVLYRSGFFINILLARVAIKNNFILVNGSFCKKAFVNLSIGDFIKISKKGLFFVYYNYFYIFIFWRRYYNYNLIFSKRLSYCFLEVDFFRLHLIVFKNLNCKNVNVFRYKPKNWLQTKLLSKFFFQIGINYGFLYKFLRFN